jgi:uncharacterized protein (DUF1015 family)
MADIKPFQCIRPAVEVADKVAALPYDVYSRKEACEEVEGKPLSFLNIDRAETQFDSSVDTYADCVYDKARELLDKAIADGVFVTDTDKAYYIYELTMDGRSQSGIVACASIDDYLNNRIKKHEKTRADKELDRINHVDRTSAQTGPIFLAYRANEVINSVVSKAKEMPALYDFTSDDGISHKVWKIADECSVTAISDAFESINSILVINSLSDKFNRLIEFRPEKYIFKKSGLTIFISSFFFTTSITELIREFDIESIYSNFDISNLPKSIIATYLVFSFLLIKKLW